MQIGGAVLAKGNGAAGGPSGFNGGAAGRIRLNAGEPASMGSTKISPVQTTGSPVGLW